MSFSIIFGDSDLCIPIHGMPKLSIDKMKLKDDTIDGIDLSQSSCVRACVRACTCADVFVICRGEIVPL